MFAKQAKILTCVTPCQELLGLELIVAVVASVQGIEKPLMLYRRRA
jgi:hypothetical protein